MEYIICPTCSTKLSTTATRCLVCGTSIPKGEIRIQRMSYPGIVDLRVIGTSASVTFEEQPGTLVEITGELTKLEKLTWEPQAGYLRIEMGNYAGNLRILVPVGTNHIWLP